METSSAGARRSPATSARSGEPYPAARLAVGLALVPAVVALAALGLPSVAVGEALASAIVFVGAVGSALLGLALACASSAVLPGRARFAIIALSLVTVAAVGWAEPSPVLGGALLDGALVAFGWAVGGGIGGRIEDPGHLLPACVVVACADVMSTLSPNGPTHAIASNPRALSLLALSFPVPGTRAFAPALGVGDLVFVALLLGAAARLGLPYRRMVACCALGLALAGAASAGLGAAVPALVPIALAVVLGMKSVRTLRARDRTVARAAMAVALGLVSATAAARLFAT